MLNANVSFGRTVKINAPLKEAVKLQKMINNPDEYSEYKQVTDKLKDTFNDVDKGEAKAFSGGLYTSYILTGEESEKAAKIKDSLMQGIESLDIYSQGGSARDFAHIMLCDKYNSDIKALISQTKSNTEIYITGHKPTAYGNITSIDIEG